jgi:NAD(P)-dependent dehydrogenase (short-subunit alcohol dehydrogenase family)
LEKSVTSTASSRDQTQLLQTKSGDERIGRVMSTRTRTALVTGSTGAIGAAIAAGIAALPDYELIALGREPVKLESLVNGLQRSFGADRIRGALVDVSSRQGIAEFAERFEGPLDVLINNAAVAPSEREQTSEGIEQVFATNVLGYLRLTRALMPFLRQSKEPRVVNVASYWAGDLDLTDLEFKRRTYHNDAAYRQSKQANRMLTAAWARRLEPERISVNCCHPGDVNSRLSNDLGFGGTTSPAAGARTPLWLAVSKEAEGLSGGYFEQQRQVVCRFSQDEAAVERLAAICDAYA